MISTHIPESPLIAFMLILRDFHEACIKLHNFGGPKIEKQVISFFYHCGKCLISSENCNPHTSYHTTAVGECLVHIRLAETLKLTLFTFSKIFIGLKNGILLHAQTGSNVYKLMYTTLHCTCHQF